MKVLIIEDEFHAAKRLKKLLLELRPEINIQNTIDSVEDAVEWLQKHAQLDLIFMDIQLADGLSFEIFKHIDIEIPVIFTTAYDQYTLRAFKVNSIDYLLKPIEQEELQSAINKYEQLQQKAAQGFDMESLRQVLGHFQPQKTYKQRFLLKQGQGWQYLLVNKVAYLYSEDSLTFAVDDNNKRHLINSSLEQLHEELDPDQFFRINRAQIIHLPAIHRVESWFNHRVRIYLNKDSKIEHVVSRNRVKAFKEWLDK
ncbi:MAG: LytTR family DNA-binding domain-containing protein [Bacteroidota bacterium]